jgi:hypothetical protein
MCLDRRIGVLAFAVLTLAGCGGGAAPEGGPGTTYDYVTAVRPLVYQNARAACSGHSLTSLAYEYGTNGPTVVAAARSWARLNQPDVRLRDVSYRGCLDGLGEAPTSPAQLAAPPLTAAEIDVYVLEYSTCFGLTVADLVQEFGLDPSSLTVEEAVHAVVRKTFAKAYRDVASDACLAAIHGEPPRYGS